MKASRARRPETTAQYVYRELKSQILQGKLQPGSRLSLRMLTKMLGVSQVPIREALLTLAAEGLITNEPHRGAEVADMTREQHDELYMIRSLLEVPAALVAAKCISSEGIEALKKLCRKTESAVKTANSNEFNRLIDKFHETFYAAANSVQLANLIRSLREATSNYRHMYLSDLSHRSTVVKYQARLVQALKVRDLEAVRELTVHRLSDDSEGFLATLPSRAEDNAESAKLNAVWKDVLGSSYGAHKTAGVF
jgi:DNA-binding GntR family transcriptional regulator